MRIIIFLLSLFIFSSISPQHSKIKELEQQRKEMLREISSTDRLLRDTKKSTSTLLNRIKLISKQISSRQQVVGLLEQEISSLTEEQGRTETEISIFEAELRDKQKSYAKAIEAMIYKQEKKNGALFVLSGKSFTESYRRLRYLKDYSEWRSKQADEIKDKSNQLKERKIKLAEMKSDKMILLSQRATEQEKLKKEETNYQSEVSEAQRKQKELQNILVEKRKQAEALDSNISRLIAEEIARQERETKRLAEERARERLVIKRERERERERKARAEASSTTSKKTKEKEEAPIIERPPVVESITASSENLSLSNNFAANKGSLPFPITGNYSITSRFGTHQHSQWNVTTSSSGIDIQSQSGAEARAVFNGEVSRIAAFAGYNNCIIIRHGNYFTFYGNIQNVYVKQGDKVKTGQSLGRAYTDPDTGQSQIHFQLWRGTSKMNPEPWLR